MQRFRSWQDDVLVRICTSLGHLDLRGVLFSVLPTSAHAYWRRFLAAVCRVVAPGAAGPGNVAGETEGWRLFPALVLISC